MRQKTFFCNNCSEKIEETERSRADGGRYCGVCRADLPAQAYGSKIFISFALLIGLFGVGGFWRGADKPLNQSAKPIASSPVNQNRSTAAQSTPANSNPPQSVKQNVSPTPAPAKTQVKENESFPAPVDDATYFCGAMTKKGTPCSRRVRGGGRCWQHKGQAAMLPPEKLLASQ